MLAQLFNICPKESCFPDCWKAHWSSLYLRMLGEMPTARNYRSVGLLSVVSKVFVKLVNNRLVDCQRNVAFFLISNMVLGLLL